jgi:SAM-dependent methyltransferase
MLKPLDISRQSLLMLVKLLPAAIRTPLTDAYWSIVELRGRRVKESLFGPRAALVPPLRLMNDGPCDYRAYKQNGDEFFDIFVRLCGLRKTDFVFDIGCGVGRKTLPLLDYLDPSCGRYQGLDVYQPHVDWCKKKIAPAYKNFHFQFVDLWSKFYNPGGQVKAADYAFPFESGSIDFVILGSVFTHLFAAEMRHYVEEISRVLRTDGRAMISYFLLNAESEGLIAAGQSSQRLVHPAGPDCRADNPNSLETAVGHSEASVLNLFRRCGLKIKIHYGSWCGRKVFVSYQDIITVEGKI